MSKTNSIKKKTTGFDIFYRVVTAILAVAIYPLFYFVDLFVIEIYHTDISDLLNSIGQNSTLYTTYEKISIHELPTWINLFSSFTNEDFNFKASVLQNALYRPVFVAIAFLAVALVLGLVVLGFAAFSNKIKVITAISGAGFLCTLASYISFTGFFAEPVLEGEITLTELFNIDGIIMSLVMQYIGDVEVFALQGGFFAVMFLLLAICLWSISVMIVNASDEKEQQMKKAAKSK
ncbi:MAG: hypothetical protein IJB72_02735 [Clostridia bacterium]|nr:hypothetical protein [Clostridia bacterium]